MRIQHYQNTGDFLQRATMFLLRAEAENAMLLGMGTRALDDTCYLATVETSGAIVACAVRTPPYGLVITRAGLAALDALVDDVAGRYETLPSVLGPEPAASAFAERWGRKKGISPRPLMRLRIFEAREVRAPAADTPGRLRPAEEHERSAITRFVVAFHEEARTGNPIDVEHTTREDIANGRLYVWDDCGIVSIATGARRTDRGAQIGLVYTLPGHRTRGCASALVAGLTRKLLDDGAVFCCINTDVTNPTTNKIYPAVGYMPVCDTSHFDLGGS
jgi:predicted GNAT family acetyltransferase